MNKILASFLLLISLAAKSQTVDEILSKHLEARGGLDKLKALQTMITHGTMVQGGVDIEMKFTYAQDKGYRVEFTAVGQTGFNIITPNEGWTFNPFAGQAAAEAMKPEQLKDAQGQLDMQGPLVDYKAKGHKVEYLGKESIQGSEFYKLKLTRANGMVATYYLDKNFLTAKTIATAVVNGTEQEVTSEYEDYRKTPEGYVIAYKRINQGVEITFDKVEINPKLDEGVFKAN